MLLKLAANQPQQQLNNLMDQLLEVMQQTTVKLVFRRSDTDPKHVIIQPVNIAYVDDVCAHLRMKGFSNGVTSDNCVDLLEKQRLVVECAGNVALGEGEETEIEFHSKLGSKFVFRDLHVKDTFLQKNFSSYSGVLRVSAVLKPIQRVLKKTDAELEKLSDLKVEFSKVCTELSSKLHALYMLTDQS